MRTQREVTVPGNNRMPTAFRSSSSAEPTAEEIRVRAYELWEERGQAPGHEVEDWVQAEQELRQQRLRRQ